MVIDDHIAGKAANHDHKTKNAEAPVLLQVRGLKKSFWFKQGLFGKKEFQAVKGVNFELRKGHTLGVVGESGSGKTTMGLTLLRLHEPTGGEVLFEGRDLLKMGASDWQKMRRRIQVVFQNPYASLNPRFTIQQTLLEPMQIHGIGANDTERLQRATALLKKVGLGEEALQKYPHEFSGGQRQRIAIARCLTLEPEVLVLDEAVSALDVTVQAQILRLLARLQHELSLTYVFISHDLAVVRQISDTVTVLQRGRQVEHGRTEDVFSNAQDPYTQRLIEAIPGASLSSGHWEI
jgi:peptide/nickel transport system ATP-binding protein